MKLSTLKIERFGARSNLQIADLSDHLNVVHGPNGSGKTTVINFIRWMLYGNVDGSLSRYLSATDGVPNIYHDGAHSNASGYPTLPSSPIYQTPRAAGEITVRRSNGHLQRIVRQDDGTATGRVSINESVGAHGGSVGHSPLNGVDLNEYRTVFSFGFDQGPSLEQVVQTVGVHGFELTVDERRLNRIQQLTEQLHRQRAELARYAHIDMRSLTERRDAIHREIANLETRKRERLVEIERQRSEILAQIEQRRSQLEGIQSWLRQVESTIETRRNQLESAAREHKNARENYEGSRQRKIEETDRQIQQWHQVLESIRSRYEELQTKHFGSGTDITPPQSFVDDDSDLRCLMSNLGYHVDDIEQDLAHLYHFDDRRDFEAKHEYLRGIMGTALQAMRADVSRLADQARHHKSAALKHEYDAEMKHLRRCETELTELIDSLSKRRNSLSAAADGMALPVNYSHPWPGHGTLPADFVAGGQKRAGEPVVRPWYESTPRDHTSLSYEAAWANGEKLTYEQWKERDRLYYAANRSVVDPITGVYRESRSRESVWPGAANDLHLTSWAYRVDPVLEARLFHLQNRREQITPRVMDLESQIRDLESRLEHLNHAYGEEDRRIEQLRAELRQIEEQLRLAQEYDRLRQAIQVTEEELARLQSDMGSSEVMREASAILNRLTCGRYSGLRITQGRQIVIDETSRGTIDYSQAGRGTRDQAYLAVCLALVAEYKRRGVEQPLILNDIFINIDEERANATAGVLSEFAAKGHQVVVFTRHERVMELLAARTAKVFPLGQRVPEFVPPKPVVREPVVREPVIPVTPPPAPKSRIVDETRTDWVSHWELPEAIAPAPPVQPMVQKVEPTPRPIERTADVDFIEDADIGLGSPLDTVPTIDVNLARHFRDIGVVTIGQFLELDPEDAAHRLTRHRISTDEIARWQSEIALQVYLCVSGSDAQILVECGISDPEELAIADLDQLLSRISGFLSSEQIRLRYQPYSRMDRDTLAGWIEMARRSNYRRRQKQNYTRRSNASRGTDYTRRTERRERPARSENRSLEPRVPVRARTAKVRTSEVSSDTDEKMKFYLNPADPIVDAPSIGPKTAERFHAVGINTVAEFLAADPVTTADQIGYRRITAEIISEWQIQARLACQIPNLRGHDAQILAACEVTTARDLSRADSSTLFNRVKRFVSTTEGKRILRNGKKPDQNEVSDWIRWSQDSRTVQVA